jgi:hypothetical protein
MLIPRKALEVVRAASKDQTRQALCGILIEPDGSTVATNGHSLVRFKPTYLDDAKEFPAIDGCNPVDEVLSLRPFILGSESVSILLKALPKKSRVLPILGNIALDVAATNNNGNAVCATTDLENPQIFKPRKVDAEFPTYQAVMPRSKPKMTIGFKREVFENVLDTLKAMNVEYFVMEIRDETGPLELKASTKEQDGIVISLIMPARVENPAPWIDIKADLDPAEIEAANRAIDDVEPADNSEPEEQEPPEPEVD